MPLLSVILPVYKSKAEHLEKALLSLKLACPIDTQILVGLDGPCDTTLTEAISKATGIQDRPQIKVLNLPRKGIVSTLNSLIEATDSRWIARQDSDDCSLPGRIIDQISEMEQRPETGFCGTQIIRCNSSLTPLKIQSRHPRRFGSQLAYASLLNNPIAHPTLVIDRLALGDIRYREAQGMEDWQLYIDLWDKGVQSFNLGSPGLLYRIHTEQITAKERDWEMLRSFKENSLNTAIKHFPQLELIRPLQKFSNKVRISEQLITGKNKFLRVG
jgi:glycosyltransferase involved in cell wall biosynthesis